MKILKFIMSRTLVFFIALWAVSIVLIDYGKIKERTMIRTLNDHTPQDFTYFLKIVETGVKQTADNQELNMHAAYYETLVRYFPQLAEAHMLLGVTYYHLGRKQDALKELEKAAALSPHFFWAQYNWGALLYELGDTKRSAEILERARFLQPQITLMQIKGSPVYHRLLLGVSNFGDIVMIKMRSGYSECLRLLVLSHLEQNDFASVIRLSHEAIAQGLDHKQLFYYYAAVASYETKQYAGSIALLKEALSIDESFLQAYEYLALNLAALGEEKKAQEVRSAALALVESGLQKTPPEGAILLKVF